jgi:hypothetical protein
MATVHPLSLRDTARECTIKLKVIHAKRTRFRLWLFGLVLKAAVIVSPCQVDITSRGA